MSLFRVEIFTTGRIRHLYCRAFCSCDAQLAIESQIKHMLADVHVGRAFKLTAKVAI